MPYIAIKGYPKDEETKKKVVDQINDIFVREWGCSPEAISISVEEVDPSDWEETVVKGEIEKKKEKMFILSGNKNY